MCILPSLVFSESMSGVVPSVGDWPMPFSLPGFSLTRSGIPIVGMSRCMTRCVLLPLSFMSSVSFL